MEAKKVVVCVLAISAILVFPFLVTNFEYQSREMLCIHTFQISPSDMVSYGFNYPITFMFALPNSHSPSLRAWHRHSETETWVQLPEKMETDFFNGEEAVRFESSEAIVSVGFYQKTQVQIMITDGEYPLSIVYEGIPKYYDNRKSAVITSHDDFGWLYAERRAEWQQAVDLFQKYEVWFSLGIVSQRNTDADWKWLQDEIDEGYVEPCSHSRTHTRKYSPLHLHDETNDDNETDSMPPLYDDYDSEIGGSKSDILCNLNPSYGEYVYVWIQPFGATDDKQMCTCGKYKYLVSREYYESGNQIIGWNMMHACMHVNPDIEMGSSKENSVAVLNMKFDADHASGGVYHLMTHPLMVDWTSGGYAEQHLAYVSGRKDVWYPPIGIFYLYQYARLSINRS